MQGRLQEERQFLYEQLKYHTSVETKETFYTLFGMEPTAKKKKQAATSATCDDSI